MRYSMYTMIHSSQNSDIQPFQSRLHIPHPQSHKGQNGKVLLVGGSSLFHAAPLWAAEMLSHMVDMVHFASTTENAAIMLQLKQSFRNGMIVLKEHIDSYAKEDDVILVGPGLLRGDGPEGAYTKNVVRHLLQIFPHKQFVIDAGALQMMEPDWLKHLSVPAIVTPHQQEFTQLFGVSLPAGDKDKTEVIVRETAKKYTCIILLKVVYDLVSDGVKSEIIEGGNAGLTKGGTGDVLSGLTAGLTVGSDPFSAAVCASWFLKTAADQLGKRDGFWYNTSDLIASIPQVMHRTV